MDKKESKEAAKTSQDMGELKRKSLKTSVYEGSAYSVSEGFGMRYITPYALALGATNVFIGFLSSFPSLIGNFSQLFTHKAISKYSRKKIAFFGALFQAIMWLAVIGTGFLFFVLNINSFISPLLLVIIYSSLIVFGAFYGPAWNSWMRDLVPERPGKYFGFRNRICGLVILISILVAGFLLDFLKGFNLFLAFSVLFSIAFIARSVSAFLFLKKYEPEFKPEPGYYFSFIQFIKKMRHNNFGKFVIYISLFNLTVAIASPFFAVYMLKDLGFSYTSYMLVTISSSFASFLFIPLWGKFSDKYGHIKILKICGLLIPSIPILWLFYNQVYYLIAVEAFSGFIWVGFNFTATNFVYDAVSKQRMAICVAYLNFINAIGVFIGATLGGLLSSLIHFNFIAPLLLIFLISGILRFAVSLLMLSKLKEVKTVEPFELKKVSKKIIYLKPKDILDFLNIRKMDF